MGCHRQQSYGGFTRKMFCVQGAHKLLPLFSEIDIEDFLDRRLLLVPRRSAINFDRDLVIEE